MLNRTARLLLCVTWLLTSILPALAADGEYEVFVGTYTGAHSKGIYSFRFNPTTGKATPPQLVAETENPSFLVVDHAGRFLYAVNEVGNYQRKSSGAVSVFSIDPASSKLTLQQQVASMGADPAYLTLDKTGRELLVANYTGGNVAVFPISADGHLGDHTAFEQHSGSSVDRERQEGPHAHSIQMTNDNRFALSADLGLDKVIIDRFDPAHGTLTPNKPEFATVKVGSGPRHLAIAPSGKFVYLLNEMATTVTVFSFDARTGTMHEQQTIDTVATHNPANTAAEIEIDHGGRFLYASTRGEDSIAEFKIDQGSGKLTLVDRTPSVGKTPRFFTLDPTGRWMFVAGQDSDNIVLFSVDQKSGKLKQTGSRIEVGSPVCLVFVPESKHSSVARFLLEDRMPLSSSLRPVQRVPSRSS